MAALTLLCSCNEVDVNDFQGCSPIPEPNPTDFGAMCDNFLIKNQLLLTKAQWSDTQKLWIKEAAGVSCVPTTAIANLKKEVEKLCSVANCNHVLKALVIAGLDRLQATSVAAKGGLP